MTTTVLLVRHGEVEGIDPPIFRGRINFPLTPRGNRQADALGATIGRHWAPEALYCSPMTRCVRTAEIIGKHLHLQAVTEPGLADMDFGAWQGLGHEDVQRRWPEAFALWRSAPAVVRPPGGEMLIQMQARAAEVLERAMRAHEQRTVVVVAHDSVNRALIAHALNLPLSAYRGICQTPCGLNVLEYAHGRFLARSINETAHLRSLEA